ncbi:SGNH/GDSL hydrolase family protein [Niabella soli]|uniref:Hydrolase n=1 Tax=Niabella soli DSM 19437 TaxID=929713 RepID=W0EUS0_9BACT|nr:SGNH/GDSL hydrolase family protein [Niabella soli]AHF14555.1 hydrolase [Niabella soli DSM 19437]
MKKLLTTALSTCLAAFLYAQQPPKPPVSYTDALSLNLIGQVFPLKKSYHRIDTAVYADFSAGIKRLLTNGAGLAISFKTNSPRITAKWCVTNARPHNNMTPIADKGLDLYIKRNGKWEFAGVGRADAVCNEFVIVQNMDRTEKECLLYLPLYDEVRSLSVGVDSGYQLTPGEDPFPKRVVVYGSSVTQGASASRPGMAYPARLSREMGVHFLNLGLSGSGKMERNVADMLATAKADAFVLDCFANPSPEQIKERTAYLVKTIRKMHPDAPIVMIQSIIRQSGNFDSTVRRLVERQNENTLKQYEQLKKDGIQRLYLIRGEDLLGNDHEGATDGIHPNDLGFDRMLQVIRPEMIRILKSNQVIK